MTESAPPEVLTESFSGIKGFWKNFWFGMSPAEFLRIELYMTPARRILTIRLFITLMIISLISVTLRPPPVVALSFTFAMMLGPLMMDYTMTLVTAFQLLKLELVAIGLSVISLVMWGDQPWFLVPWSYSLITLLLFYSRVTGTPTIPALLYVFAVFYHPEQPDQNIYEALWLFPTLGILAFGTSIAAQLLLWPQDPEKLLNQQLTERFDTIGRILHRLSEFDGVSQARILPAASERPALGSVSRQFTLLAHAELAHSKLRVKHDEWTDLIAEIDTWFNIVSKLDCIINEAHPRPALTGYDLARIQVISAECCELRANFHDAETPIPELPKKVENLENPSAANDPVSLLLHRLDDAALRVRKTLVALHGQGIPSNANQPMPEQVEEQTMMPVWLPKQFWIDNLDALHYGMKFALGVMICFFLVQAFQWPGIDTAILTCVIVAQSSMGADYRKSAMRIMGASLGGLLAYVFIIVLEPALDTIAGFLLAIAPVCWLSAWVGSGSPRIAYIGTQIGYSFAHAVLSGYGPITDLAIVRDRVLGILLGITVMGVINYLLWPQHSERMLINRFVIILHKLDKFLRHETATPTSRRSSAALLKAIDSDLQKALNFLENARIEPGANQQGAESKRATMSLVIGVLYSIARVIQARHRYFLSEEFRSQTESLRDRQNILYDYLSGGLLNIADLLAGKASVFSHSNQQALLELQDAANHLTGNPAINSRSAKSILACIGLDQILWEYINELNSLVSSIAETVSADPAPFSSN